MFIGNIDNIDGEESEFHPIIFEVLKYLRETNFETFKDGSYPVENCKNCVARVQRYKTKSVETCRPEAHEKFIDVQYIFKGEEILGWCPLSPDLKVSESYNSENDVVFFEEILPDSTVVFGEKNYAVLFPLDVHRPCGSVEEDNPEEVLKVVVKVPVSAVE